MRIYRFNSVCKHNFLSEIFTIISLFYQQKPPLLYYEYEDIKDVTNCFYCSCVVPWCWMLSGWHSCCIYSNVTLLELFDISS